MAVVTSIRVDGSHREGSAVWEKSTPIHYEHLVEIKSL